MPKLAMQAGGVISVRTHCSLVTALLDAALQQTKPGLPINQHPHACLGKLV